MELINIGSKAKGGLLRLPREDLYTSETGSTGSSNELLLMQLPKEVSISDLASASRFIVPRDNKRPACLVVESTKSSYTVSRLETSNTIIVVPPVDALSRKRAKLNENSDKMFPMPSRLLKAGGSGASFLKLRQKTFRLQEVADMLKPHIYDPMQENSCRGITIESISSQLQSSTSQVKEALFKINAFAIPNADSQPPYAILADKAKSVADDAILSTLVECDEYEDYTTREIVVDEFVNHAVDRLGPSIRMAHQKAVLRHCLFTMERADSTSMNRKPKVLLDFKKVAITLAHHLFKNQESTWEESNFLQKWQSNLPGVGGAYEVSMKLLRGVAISFQEEGKNVLHYFPEDKLPLDPGSRFEALFQFKELWRKDELEPYLVQIIDDESGRSQQNLLSTYTVENSEPSEDGEYIQFFARKV